MTDPDNPSPVSDGPDKTTGPTSALDWARRTAMTSVVLAELRRLERRRHRRQLTGLALGFAAAVVAMVAVIQFVPAKPEAGQAAVGVLTVTPPQRQVLPDGSVVELKDGAEIAVGYTADTRRVVLHRGTAHFTVAKAPDRPFVVVADEILVQAVGTAFSVDLMHRAVDVLVTEGQVSVTAGPKHGQESATVAQQALLNAGERVLVDQLAADRRLMIAPIQPAEYETKLGWRVPKLDFLRTPLADVLATFNRYNERQLVLGDPALGDLRVSGTLRADKTDALLEMLRQSFGLRAENRGERDIVINR